MMRVVMALAAGAVFGLGIALSGMGNPAKVVNFFDVAGSWDPSLAFVMGGALLVATPGYALLFRRRARPLLAERFALPTARDVDAPLLAGAAIFGVGWGISGFCPGGALPVVSTGRPEVALFVAAVIAGILAARMTTGLIWPLPRPARHG